MNTVEYNLCVENFADSLFCFIRKMLRDEDNAKDIVQESFVRLWERHEEVNITTQKSYLYTIAYRLAIDAIRKNKKKCAYEPEKINLSVRADEVDYGSRLEIQTIVAKAAEVLPEIQYRILLLRDWEGYSYKEISEVTGLSESQVKVYIFRARTSLKEKIGNINRLI